MFVVHKINSWKFLKLKVMIRSVMSTTVFMHSHYNYNLVLEGGRIIHQVFQLEQSSPCLVEFCGYSIHGLKYLTLAE